MEIFIKKNKDGKYDTELFNLLKSLPKEYTFNKEHGLREPLAFYHISTSRLVNAAKNLINTLEPQAGKISDDRMKKIQLDHEELLESIMSFVDSGYQIMKCLYPKSRVQEKIILSDQWLIKADSMIFREYKSLIRPYREKTAEIVNKVKHENAICCLIQGRTAYGTVLGYYLQSVDENGAIIPNKKVHKDFNGIHTGISYNKDILDQILNIFIICNHMTKTIKKILKKEHNIDIEIHDFEENDKNMAELLELTKIVKKLFLSNEYNKDDFPQIDFLNEDIRIKKPAYSGYMKKLFEPKEYEMSVIFTFYGERTIALPYFKGES